MTDNLEELERQIDRLANFIMHKIEGEPSQSQGAVDTAIRIMGDQAREVEGLRAKLAEQARDALAADAQAMEREEGLRAEVADLKSSVIAFAGPAAVQWSEMFGLPKDHLHPHHYDLLERCGARLDDFTRAALKGKGG